MGSGTRGDRRGYASQRAGRFTTAFLLVAVLGLGAGSGALRSADGTAHVGSGLTAPAQPEPPIAGGVRAPTTPSPAATVSPAAAAVVLDTLDLYNNSVVAGNYIPSGVSNGYSPFAVAYDSTKDALFVANTQGDNVSVISDTTYKMLATIPVGVGPTSLAFDSGLGTIYVGDSGSNEVTEISDSTDDVIATIHLGASPQSLAYDPSDSHVFVADGGTDRVSVIADSSDHILTNISVGTDPVAVAFDSLLGEVFVANAGSDDLSVLSATTEEVVATVPLYGAPSALAYDGTQREIFAACAGPDNLSVVSDASNTVTANVSVGFVPHGMAFDSPAGELFLTDSSTDTTWVVWDANDSSRSLVTTGLQPTGIAFDTGVGLLFVANDLGGTISILFPGSSTPPPTISSFAIDPSTVRVDLSTSFVVTATGGVNPLTYTYVGLPPGCVSRDSLSWSCTATLAGTYHPRIFLNDSARNSVNASALLVVTPPPATNYSLTFAESNLAYGTNWSVTILGQTISSVTSDVVFGLPNGTYPFSVGTVSGYTETPSSGTVNLTGAAVSVNVAFTLTAGKSNSASGLFGLPGSEGVELVVGIIAVVLVLVVGMMVFRGGSPPPMGAKRPPAPAAAAEPTDPDVIDLSPDQVRE